MFLTKRIETQVYENSWDKSEWDDITIYQSKFQGIHRLRSDRIYKRSSFYMTRSYCDQPCCRPSKYIRWTQKQGV